jgi:hypothetical protein
VARQFFFKIQSSCSFGFWFPEKTLHCWVNFIKNVFINGTTIKRFPDMTRQSYSWVFSIRKTIKVKYVFSRRT